MCDLCGEVHSLLDPRLILHEAILWRESREQGLFSVSGSGRPGEGGQEVWRQQEANAGEEGWIEEMSKLFSDKAPAMAAPKQTSTRQNTDTGTGTRPTPSKFKIGTSAPREQQTLGRAPKGSLK